MTNFNEFYNTLLNMDEDELHNVVLAMGQVVMEEQKKKQEEQKIKEVTIKKERVM